MQLRPPQFEGFETERKRGAPRARRFIFDSVHPVAEFLYLVVMRARMLLKHSNRFCVVFTPQSHSCAPSSGFSSTKMRPASF